MHVSSTAWEAEPEAPSRDWLMLAEGALVVLFLLMFSEGLLARLLASEQEPDGSPILRLMWLPVYGLTLLACAWRAKDVAIAMAKMPFLCVLLVLATVSYMWSIDPSLTQRRAIAIVMTTMFGVYIGIRFDWLTLLRLFAITWFILAVLSLAIGAVNRSFVEMDEIHVGAWRMLWWEKNSAGGHMARAAFLFFFLAIIDKPYRWLWAAGGPLAILLVILSTSKTSLLGLMLGLGILVLAAWMRRGPASTIILTWFSVIGTAIGIAMLTLAPEFTFGLIGREPTLTGRTDIWAALADAIAERPWLGYGYGTFWAPDSTPGYWVRVAVQWVAPTAHNGWLETALSIGLIGLAFMVAHFLLVFYRAFRLAISDWYGVFVLGVLAQFLLFSMSESIALQQNAIVWVTFVAFAARLARDGRPYSEQRFAAVPAYSRSAGFGFAAPRLPH